MELKCLICVNTNLLNKDISTSQPVFDAIMEADVAVVVVSGTSMCASHYQRHMINLSITGIKS